MKKYRPENIRDGIFALNTRRFGTVAELLIKSLAKVGWGKSFGHDLFDDNELNRIEVKFSRALKRNNEAINEKNVLEQIASADDKARMFKASEWKKYSFDCNIQQFKREEFDLLYYGIFFSDKVMIFKILSSQITEEINYSNKQHRGNEGEGQFHLNNQTYEHHLEHFFEKELSYKEVLRILTKINKTSGNSDAIYFLSVLL